MSDAEKIAHTVLGQDVTIEDCEVLANAVETRQLKSGEILYEEGTKDDTLYILITGKLNVVKMLSSGKSVHIDTLKEGAMSGELSFIDGDSHSLHIIAKSDSEVLLLHREKFESLVETHPLVTFHVMRSILRYSHKLQRKMNAKYLEMTRLVQNQYTAQY
ncbi:cyclic nucleotide-binding domain-containing protein [Thiomicrorhabdus sp. ZW0627]|uniref:Crp/Fnr family transcriptional regulator n=1 Tax=Thiomicrorhabdus sp. ZW0627 TaxID=3039774 RepID=UPI002436CA0F|nr:cyclic nucleotide-binding domain-containing protein [Thiomicrorhabdus sp. ZW0627]MDG6773012.1 cyclic nucleotide-binding domain-containing protein [Thiomicrorhabdus sp. ZW0627]